MEGKQETPNPINPQDGPIPPKPPVEQSPVQPAVQQATPEEQPAPIVESPTSTVEQPTAQQATPEKQTAPAIEPPASTADQSVIVEPAKKKTGLIIGLVIGILALVGGATAAALLLMPKPSTTDPVATAMERIMSGKTPNNIAIDGEINILSNDDSAEIKRVNVKLDSDIAVGSMINTSSAILTITDANDNDASFEFDEVYSEAGDLYFKIEGLDNLSELDIEGIEEVGISSFESIDGTWLRISPEVFSSMIDEQESSPISCVTDLVGDLDKTVSTTASNYEKYPFVKSTISNVIPKNQTQVYQVSLDADNFANFVGAIQNSSIVQDVYSCLDYEDAPSLTADGVDKLISQMPKTFVEVNDNNDFSRLYLDTVIGDGPATATIDLNFKYINKVTADEPVEYTDFTTLIQKIMSNFYEVENDANIVNGKN